MSETEPSIRPGDPHPALLRALMRLLRPLVRVLIAKGVTYPALSRLLKQVYVDVAVAEFPLEGKRQTDSRIHLLTGIHRKDIKTLREEPPSPGGPSPVVSRNAHMIALWTGSPDYLDTAGRPLALPRHKGDDNGPTFEGLVAAVNKDIRARAVLDEWLRLELVRLDGDVVHLNRAAFVPREDFSDIAYYFGRNLADHIAASGHNLMDEGPPFLERAVYYETLTEESVGELRDLAHSLGSDVLVEVNKRAFQLAEQDQSKAGADRRMTFGVYFFSGPDDPDDDTG